VSDLAERIKALKAAHSIEPTPQRVRTKQSTAEEPVTARIRRRQETTSASDGALEDDSAPGADEALPPRVHSASIKRPMTFQQRIAMERQRDQDGPAAHR
jgi:hypothetical protein